MLPDGWKSYCLGNVFKLTSGKSRPKKYLSPKAIGNEIPVFGGNGITGYTSDFLIENQTIVIGRVGEYCGCVRLSPGQAWITDNALYICEIYLEQDLLFLSYLLKFANLEKLRNETGQPLISQKPIYDLVLAFPPLHEQKKIAAILSSVDEAITSTQAVIDQTHKVKQGLLQQLLTRGIGHTKFKESAIGKIPELWKLKRINELGEVQAGRQRSPHFTEGKIRPYLRVANVFDGYIDTSDVLEMAFTEDEYKRYCLRDGDILLNEGQSLDLVGRSAIYRGVPKNCCFQNTLIRFRAYKDINIEFAQTLFQFLQYSGRFSAIALQTTSIAHLGVSRFASLEVMLPPYEEQCQIAEIFSVQQKALNTEREKLLQLQILKRGLMQDFLTGKVRVGCTS